MKLLIWIGITVGGTIGGWAGASVTKGNWFSLPSILLSGVGSLLGVWIAYKLAKEYL